VWTTSCRLVRQRTIWMGRGCRVVGNLVNAQPRRVATTPALDAAPGIRCREGGGLGGESLLGVRSVRTTPRQDAPLPRVRNCSLDPTFSNCIRHSNACVYFLATIQETLTSAMKCPSHAAGLNGCGDREISPDHRQRVSPETGGSRFR
jgi:hypothetical protein